MQAARGRIWGHAPQQPRTRGACGGPPAAHPRGVGVAATVQLVLARQVADHRVGLHQVEVCVLINHAGVQWGRGAKGRGLCGRQAWRARAIAAAFAPGASCADPGIWPHAAPGSPPRGLAIGVGVEVTLLVFIPGRRHRQWLVGRVRQRMQSGCRSPAVTRRPRPTPCRCRRAPLDGLQREWLLGVGADQLRHLAAAGRGGDGWISGRTRAAAAGSGAGGAGISGRHRHRGPLPAASLHLTGP